MHLFRRITLLSLFALLLLCRARTAPAPEWLPFSPPPDSFDGNGLDLRFLNEKFAGEHGAILSSNGHFVRAGDRKPVRFWAVNGPPDPIKDPAELRRVARVLAKRGVNLVRIHGAVFDESGEADPTRIQHAIDIIEAMKAEGIYSHASIYFPLWFRPKADLAWLKGYDGKKNPFAALMFNPGFEAKYRSWWEALLRTPGARSGKKLLDEPALMGVELQNEDSFFFWTFSEGNIPDEQLRLLETQFGHWLSRKYGSLEKAFARWDAPPLKRDAPDEGRVAFRPLWNIAHDRARRDEDTTQFLFETQKAFYGRSIEFLHRLGFKGLICASNWATASPEVLGPLEKLSYVGGDFIDRHGYFSCFHQGEASEWSIRNGHTYADRSGFRFDNIEPGKPRSFVHPAMDPKYAGKPSMISETTWTRPNRYRSEAPLYLAAYGALQDSDAIIHFAFDGASWSVKPNFWMQPWTLMSPAMFGQFPAAALIYRLGLIEPGAVVARVNLNPKQLLELKGTPLPQDASLDELRLKDLPAGANLRPGERLDPLLHYTGQVSVSFQNEQTKVVLPSSGGLIDHDRQIVISSHRQLQLDYGKGVLRIDAPKAQGASGNLASAGTIQLADLALQSDLDLLHVVAVPLDGRPIGSSAKLLLQVMSEEQNSDWSIEAEPRGKKRIASVGRDPWTIRAIQGRVRFTRPNAESLKVTALDPNGNRVKVVGDAREINLRPDVLYYLIEGQSSAPPLE